MKISGILKYLFQYFMWTISPSHAHPHNYLLRPTSPCYSMMTSSNGTFSALLAICAGNSPVPGEFPPQMASNVELWCFFDLRPNTRLSKHWWGWWFEQLSSPLWRHRDWLATFSKAFRKVLQKLWFFITFSVDSLWYLLGTLCGTMPVITWNCVITHCLMR